MNKIILIIFLLNGLYYGQEDSHRSYFPLSSGNLWQYKVTHTTSRSDSQSTYYSYTKVISDTLIENQNKTYYKVRLAFSGIPYYGDSIKYYRYDSLSSSIYAYHILEKKEMALFKLNAAINDCWRYYYDEICCNEINSKVIFEQEINYKHFLKWERPSWGISFAEGIGPIKIVNNQSYVIISYYTYDLVYAKVAGREYGSYVPSINQNMPIPSTYYISQNYPNPFNPSTTIKYSIPESGHVTIVIYNALGQEVKKIVNSEKIAGNYEIVFNGQELSTGIYYYRIKCGEYAETKKMVLVK